MKYCYTHGTDQCDCVTQVVRRGVDNALCGVVTFVFFFIGLMLIGYGVVGPHMGGEYVSRVFAVLAGLGVWLFVLTRENWG